MNDITGMDIVKFTNKYSPDTKVILTTSGDIIVDAFGAVRTGRAGIYGYQPERLVLAGLCPICFNLRPAQTQQSHYTCNRFQSLYLRIIPLLR